MLKEETKKIISETEWIKLQTKDRYEKEKATAKKTFTQQLLQQGRSIVMTIGAFYFLWFGMNMIGVNPDHVFDTHFLFIALALGLGTLVLFFT